MSENGDYSSERSAAVEAMHKDAEHFDKSILTLSASAFGVSIAFVRFIAPNPTGDSRMYLAIAYALLIASICSTLLSLLTSQRGFAHLVNYLDSRLMGSELSTYKNRAADVTNILNWFSWLAFTFGIASLAFFAYTNTGT